MSKRHRDMSENKHFPGNMAMNMGFEVSGVGANSVRPYILNDRRERFKTVPIRIERA